MNKNSSSKKSLTKEEKEKIFYQYENLVHSIVNNYGYNAKDYKQDLEQIAFMELWECIDRYDASKDTSFLTYATWCITSKVKQGLVERSGLFKRSTSIPFRTALYIMQNKDKDSEQLISELEKFNWYNLSRSSFFAIYDNCVNLTVSLESITDDGESIGIDIEDDVNIEIDTEDKLYVIDCLNKIQSALSKVKSERNVELYMKYLNSFVYDNKITLEDLGMMYGITRERARQIIKSMNRMVIKMGEKWRSREGREIDKIYKDNKLNIIKK